MTKLKDWTAKRSGAAMTVFGIDADTGEKIRISNVRSIGPQEPAVDCVFAVEHQADGSIKAHTLLCSGKG